MITVIFLVNNVEALCNDSDVTADYPDGKNIYTSGYVTYCRGENSCYTLNDICRTRRDTSYVYERYCNNNSMPRISYAKCDDGCDGNACKIVATCTDDCSTSGDKQCSGNGYQTCGNYDNDSCLEWSSTTNCYSNQTCTDGECVATCTDDCSTSGAKKCDGTTGYQTCGNYDTDSCLEWSSTTNCDYTKTCKSGNCVKKDWPIGLVTFECNVNDGCYFTNNLETDDELIITLKIEPKPVKFLLVFTK